MFRFKLRNIFLFFVSFFIIGLSSKYNEATQIIYTNGINKFIRENLSLVFGKIPFPVGDILTIVLFVLICYFIYHIIDNIIHPDDFPKFISRLFWGTVNFISVFLFLYLLFNGLNYNTPSLETAMIERYNTKYSANADVKVDTEKMTEVFKNIQKKAIQAKEDMKGTQMEDSSFYGISKKAVEGYNSIIDVFPNMSGNYQDAKESIISPVMNLFGLQGRYYVVTNEVSISNKVPRFLRQFVISKYMAYQRGVVREDEANFYGYLACINNSDPTFKYAGTVAMLDNILLSLRENDKVNYNIAYNAMDPEIKKDIKEIEKYKENFGFMSPLTEKFKYTFKRLNGDVRVDDVASQTSVLLAAYYSLYSY